MKQLVPPASPPADPANGLDLRPYTTAVRVNETRSLVILSGAKDLKIRNLRSFAVYAAQDDGGTGVALSQDHWADPAASSPVARAAGETPADQPARRRRDE
jgi:hypothetical protein